MEEEKGLKKKIIKGNESLRDQALNVYHQLHSNHSITTIVNSPLHVPTDKMIIFILFFSSTSSSDVQNGKQIKMTSIM